MARTYNEIYLEGRRRLREAGFAEYALEARRLLALAAGYADSELVARLPMYVGPGVEERMEGYLERRLRGEPAAYICGSWDFYGLPMVVSENVLIPRMDTEVLVDTALRFLRAGRPDAHILDLCCGSGCIGCALATRMPSARVVLGDISPEALSVARKNVALHKLRARCVCLDADAFSPPPIRMEGYDMLVSNPPYIPAGEIPTLDPSVRDWEPIMALDGGEDGLDFYRAILKNWKSVLRDGGTVIFEVGEGQADPVRALMEEAGFDRTGAVKDTAGTERVVFAQKK